jgi:hypothetical protein
VQLGSHARNVTREMGFIDSIAIYVPVALSTLGCRFASSLGGLFVVAALARIRVATDFPTSVDAAVRAKLG